MDITNLDDHRKIWKTDAAGCAACGHQWQAVYPIGAEDVGLECPACGSGLGSVLPNDDKSKLSPNDDIVERLRICAKYDPDQAEAADEIERLRKALQDIADFSLYGDYSNAYEMPIIATRALAGKIEGAK